jgi:hypothetical protein
MILNQKQIYSSDDRLLIIFMAIPRLVGMSIAFLGKIYFDINLVFLGVFLLIASQFLSSWMGFTKNIILTTFSPPPISIYKGAKAKEAAKVDLVIGVIGLIILTTIFMKYNIY